MKPRSIALFVAFLACVASPVSAAVTVGHIENVSVGQFLSSSGSALTAGGVSIGIFTDGLGAPITVADSAFNTVTAFADLIALGFKDIRSLSGATAAAGTDWAFPLAVSGSYNSIAISALPAATQLYLLAFNAGSYVAGTPASSFASATEWAVVKDTTSHKSPSDLGTASLLLNTVVPGDILKGTDNGNNVNMTALGAVPEPSRALLGMIGLVALFVRRRR